MKHAPGFMKLVSSARKKVKEITVARVKSMLKQQDNTVLIDVREDHEWNEGHIPGAIHMGRGVLERDIENAIPDKKTEVVLYCRGGFRSILSAESLKKMGYRNVHSMKGGWRGWRKGRGPVERGPG